MYDHGGSTSFKRENRLAECWRFLHTVGQTVTLAPEWYPIGGRVYLGLEPGARLRELRRLKSASLQFDRAIFTLAFNYESRSPSSKLLSQATQTGVYRAD